LASVKGSFGVVCPPPGNWGSSESIHIKLLAH
jgi:hypothetical protein